MEVLLRWVGSLVPPWVWDASQPLAHRYAVGHDCASSNPGFRAAIANSYIRGSVAAALCIGPCAMSTSGTAVASFWPWMARGS